MKRSYTTFAMALVLVFAGGCAREISRDSGGPTNSPASSAQFPPGIAGYDSSAGFARGIYEAPPNQCCFLAGAAALTLENPPSSRTATFHFYVPNVKPYVEKGLTITIKVAGISKTTVVRQGDASISMPLPANIGTTAHVPVHIIATPTFVPKQYGINDDPRALSALLLSVTYSDKSMAI